MKYLKKSTAVLCSILLICLMVATTVSENASAAAKLKSTKMNLTVNKTSQITINGKVKNATYTYKSSNTKIATVSKTGVVKGVKVGTAMITVNSTYQKKVTKVGTVKVTVKKAVKPTAVPTITPEVDPTITPTQAPEVTVKLVALTFDDGPSPNTTRDVLDKLKKHEVVASFFLLGKSITTNSKPIMERMLEMGCEINNHSWSHTNMTTLTAEEIKKEVEDTNQKIFEMVGVTPKFFRPPYIAVNATVYSSISLPFINGISCNDWDASVSAEKRAETVLSLVKDGSIILMHDSEGNKNTVKALDIIIPELKARGYEFVTVSQLFEYKGVDPNKKNMLWSQVTK